MHKFEDGTHCQCDKATKAHQCLYGINGLKNACFSINELYQFICLSNDYEPSNEDFHKIKILLLCVRSTAIVILQLIIIFAKY